MKEKSFAQELAELINRHGIDAKMNTNDWILADVAVDALNAYGKVNQLKEVEAMAAFFADMFPGSEIQIQRVDLKKNPRNKCRAKNKRKGGRTMKNKCSSEIPNMPTGCAPDNRRSEKIYGKPARYVWQ